MGSTGNGWQRGKPTRLTHGEHREVKALWSTVLPDEETQWSAGRADDNSAGEDRINVSESDNRSLHNAMLTFDDNSCGGSGSRRTELR